MHVHNVWTLLLGNIIFWSSEVLVVEETPFKMLFECVTFYFRL